MARIAEKHFSDEEIRVLVAKAKGIANYCRLQNKQDHYEMYESLATVILQLQAAEGVLCQ